MTSSSMLDIRFYFKLLVKWWWLIALSILLAAVSSYYYSSQKPRLYNASTTLMVGQVTQLASPSTQDFYTTEQLAETYATIALRQPVLQATIDSLGYNIPWQELRGRVYASQIPRTQLLQISVVDVSPDAAVAIADELAHQLILQSPASVNNQLLEDRGGFIQSQLDRLQIRIEGAQEQVIALQTELDEAFSASEIQDLQTEISSLETLIRDWQSTYTELLGYLQGDDNPNYLTVIEPAQRPYNPFSPNTRMDVLLAVGVGLALAVGSILVLEFIDDTIKPNEELSQTLNSVVLGYISRIDGQNRADRIINQKSLHAPTAEEYRHIRSNLQFMSLEKPVKTILVTSSEPGEGKSTTATNLAIILSQAGLKTVLIDADLRRSMVHELLSASNLVGLSDTLIQPEQKLETYLQQTEFENLVVLPSGTPPPNPAELLGSSKMFDLINTLRNHFDMVVIDSPPIAVVSDSVSLASWVDGVIVVARSQHTRYASYRQTLEQLKRVEAHILGTILNYVKQKQRVGYYYGHYNATSSTTEPSVWWQSGLRWVQSHLPGSKPEPAPTALTDPTASSPPESLTSPK